MYVKYCLAKMYYFPKVSKFKANVLMRHPEKHPNITEAQSENHT